MRQIALATFAPAQLSYEAPTHWARYPRPAAEVSAGLRLQW